MLLPFTNLPMLLVPNFTISLLLIIAEAEEAILSYCVLPALQKFMNICSSTYTMAVESIQIPLFFNTLLCLIILFVSSGTS